MHLVRMSASTTVNKSHSEHAEHKPTEVGERNCIDNTPALIYFIPLDFQSKASSHPTSRSITSNHISCMYSHCWTLFDMITIAVMRFTKACFITSLSSTNDRPRMSFGNIHPLTISGNTDTGLMTSLSFQPVRRWTRSQRKVTWMVSLESEQGSS